MIRFRVNGIPKGQPRPRAFAKPIGNGKWTARVYDKGTAEGWKGDIAIAARAHLPETPIQGPVQIELAFEMPRPKGHFNSKGMLKPLSPEWHTGKPDVDNMAKAALDALTTLGMWADDGQVVTCHIVKRYATDKPGVLISIWEYETPEGAAAQPPRPARAAGPRQLAIFGSAVHMTK